ncbi:MAG: hypothetical protein MJY89_02350 [Bacteroidales bacterium]|nr:hypothetical protein [Bacteroidales bacterium]
MFVFSVVMAIVGSKKNSRKKRLENGRADTPYERAFRFDEAAEEERPDDKTILAERFGTVPLGDAVPFVEEGVSAIHDKIAPAIEEPVPERKEKKVEMDAEEKRKLIIYSEILRPKFDA